MLFEKKLSVVIPTYNREVSICDCIESVLNQTHAPYEIIVVDDGSVDNTKEVLAPYFSRIKYFWKENGGVSSARNFGVMQATGDWIAFLDSDDVWYPNRIKLLLDDLDLFPSIRVHVAELNVYTSAGLKPLYASRRVVSEKGLVTLLNSPLMFVLDGISPISAAIEREYFLQLGGFDEEKNIYEDLLLFGKAAVDCEWGLNLTPIAEAKRIVGDDLALTNIETKDPLYSAEMYFQCLEEFNTQVSDRRIAAAINKRMSGLLLWLSSRNGRCQKPGNLKMLYCSIRLHPSKLKATAKAMICLLLGAYGHSFVFRKRYESFRR